MDKERNIIVSLSELNGGVVMKKLFLPMILAITLFTAGSSALAVRRFSIHDSANLAGVVEVYGQLQTTYNYYLEVTDTSIEGESGATSTNYRDKEYHFKITNDQIYEGVIESRTATWNYRFNATNDGIQGTVKGESNTYTYDLKFVDNKLKGKITPEKGPVKNFDIAYLEDGIISGYIGDLLAKHRVKLEYRDEQLRGKITGRRNPSGREITMKFRITIPEMTRPMFSMIVFNIIYQDLMIDIANEKITF